MLDSNINPLNAYNLRRVAYCPPYFVTIQLNSDHIDSVVDWIYENLQGRFYCGKRNIAASDLIGSITSNRFTIGFELAEEATLFGLSLGTFSK
jgi:hypothetical protein